MMVFGAVYGSMRGSIENYRVMHGMAVSPLETVFFGLVAAVFGFVKFFVPMILFLLVGGIYVHKKLTGKMPKILPTDVMVSLGCGGVASVVFGWIFYSSFATGNGMNMALLKTSIQVGVLVFLSMFFMLLSLLNLCNIGRFERNVKDEKVGGEPSKK